MTRRHVVWMLGVVTLLTATAMGSSASGSAAAPVAAATVRSGPGVWVQLSSGAGLENTEDPSVHRFDSNLQVVWEQDLSGSEDALRTRILAANGAPASGNESVLQWSSVHQDPVIFASGGRRVIAFSGLSSGAYAGGRGYYLTSANGTKWTLADGTFGSYTGLYDNTGADATDAGGTPVLAYSVGFGLGYRAGYDSLPPVTTDHGVSPDSGACCNYDAGVGYDATTRQTWMTWYSNDGKAANGVDALRIYPGGARSVHAPDSSSRYNGQVSSVGPEQRVQVAARHGGGLYTAYGVGYPSQSTIALWRLGSRTPLLLRTREQIQDVGITAAPGGRLWVFWSDLNTGLLHAVRTNTAGTRFGAVRTVRPPARTGAIWTTAGDGGTGRLDLIVNVSVTRSLQLFATQVLPGLSARVSPTTIRSSRGGRIVVTVTDAGAVVRGATVRFGRSSRTTNAHGQVAFTVAKHTRKGTYALVFAGRDYAGGVLHVRVD